MLTHEQGMTLVALARSSIAEALGAPHVPDPEGAFLHARAATFVTLHRRGRLHGCIGSIEPRRSLLEDVRHNAVAAALHDPRAGYLDVDGVDELEIEVSLLSPLEPIAFDSEASALAQIREGEDGVVIAFGSERATFLPQVWESLPDKEEFMRQLKRKAGLPGNFWHPAMRVHRFSVAKWSSEDLDGSRAPRPGPSHHREARS